jgi:hypothetical protein
LGYGIDSESDALTPFDAREPQKIQKSPKKSGGGFSPMRKDLVYALIYEFFLLK